MELKEMLGTLLGVVAIIIFATIMIMFVYILFKIMLDEFDSKNLKNLKKENKDLQRSVDEIYEDYQDIGKMYFDLQEKVDDVVEYIKKKSNIESKEKEYILKRLEDKK